MGLSLRWRRRTGALWAGIVPAWGATLVVANLRFPEEVKPIAVVASILAVAAGCYMTLRFRAADQEPLITVKDLRRS